LSPAGRFSRKTGGGLPEPFIFYTQQQLIALTGRRARNLSQLLEHLRTVTGSSIFYHTHYLYLTQHFVEPKFYNEFADWVSTALQERGLAERIGAIDLRSASSLREIRSRIIAEIERHFAENPGPQRDCPPGDEFQFCEARSFIVPNGIVARNVPEFFEKLQYVSNACLHFHFFEARLRLDRPTNDFSIWLSACGETRLAGAIDNLDPYVVSLDELKTQIRKIGRRQVRQLA
jgi:hypothetical protein